MPNKHTLRILVIEYNPLLSDGKRVSDLVNLTDSIRPAVDELIDDIRYSSHGLVNCEIAAWEREDGFPHHKKMFRLESGESPCLDEPTVRRLFANGWYGFWNNDWFNEEVCPEDIGFSLDYQWMLEKHNIIERRNNGEFNMIFVVNQDPVYGFEACMLGRNAYWINGDPIEADCPLTAILNVSVSRRDANYECHGHMMENIMSHVFHGDTIVSGYDKGEFNGENPAEMSVWKQFVLADRNFDGLAACGNSTSPPIPSLTTTGATKPLWNPTGGTGWKTTPTSRASMNPPTSGRTSPWASVKRTPADSITAGGSCVCPMWPV